MCNRFYFCAVLICLCFSVFSQDMRDEAPAEAEGTNSDRGNLIDNFFWYQKYLPIEDISHFYTLRNSLVYLKTKNSEDFDNLSIELEKHINAFDNQVRKKMEHEISDTNIKINILMRLHSSNIQVIELNDEYQDLEKNVKNGNYPQDDEILDKIDELYSQLITRLGRGNIISLCEYTIRVGDYLRKIAKEHYGNELRWREIYDYEANRNKFTGNPDLIYPGRVITIP